MSLVYFSFIEDLVCEMFYGVWCVDFIECLMSVVEMRMSSHFEIERALCMAPHALTYANLNSC